jgi:hypothetical protein
MPPILILIIIIIICDSAPLPASSISTQGGRSFAKKKKKKKKKKTHDGFFTFFQFLGVLKTPPHKTNPWINDILKKKKKKKKKNTHAWLLHLFPVLAGIKHPRRVSRRFLGVPDRGAPNKSKYPGFFFFSFWCWTVLQETAPYPAGYHGGT